MAGRDDSREEPRLALVAHLRETIRRVGAEEYAAGRLPYVVGRVVEEVGRG